MSGGEITALLERAGAGEPGCLDSVFERLYPELKRLAGARIAAGERTLSPTVLVHEVYLRMIRNATLSLSGRSHFMACAARAMRAVVVDHLRSVNAQKRGGDAQTITLDESLDALAVAPFDPLAIDAALVALDQIDSAQRELVELHYFAGIALQEIAAMRGVSEKTVQRHWQRARAFLRAQLSDPDAALR
jgi:RNA polymerase sigma factor (TIGR02999 family)